MEITCEQALVNHIPDSENITFHDLYEQYPNFDIDVKFERLNKHHHHLAYHPTYYWYSYMV
jgi:glutathione-regulated potassium-efflux system ancillary protein KefG